MTDNSSVAENILLPQVPYLPLTDFVRGREPDFVVGNSVDLGSVAQALFSDRTVREGREVVIRRESQGGVGLFGSSIIREHRETRVGYYVNGNLLQTNDALYFR
tara:strand:+ start:164 stop:475 length:312 start_codon:yes stop_codon:yes gene_type:complete